MNASDLLKQLENDSEYNRNKKIKEEEFYKKTLEIKVIEAPFIKCLHANGFNEIEFISDLLKLTSINPDLTTLILKWIPKIDNKNQSQEMLVRALAIAQEPFDGTLLTNLFDSESSVFSLKWAIANTIACATVNNITGWLEEKLISNNLNKECEMLVYASVKYFSYEKAIETLKKLYGIFPLQVIDAFTYIGKPEDIEFLETNRAKYKGHVRTALDKAIRKIRKKFDL